MPDENFIEQEFRRGIGELLILWSGVGVPINGVSNHEPYSYLSSECCKESLPTPHLQLFNVTID